MATKAQSQWFYTKLGIGLSFGAAIGLLSLAGARAAEPSPTVEEPVPFDEMTRLLLSAPPDLQLTQPGAVLPNPDIVTANTVSQFGLTTPSLWWARDQFGEQLLETWLAYPASSDSPQRVELVVNPQVWSIYNYLERYTFVNHFGSSASAYGYSTRVFDRQGNLLAAYVCDFSATPARQRVAQQDCNIVLRSEGIAGITGRVTPTAEAPTTAPEIGQR